MTIKVKHPRLPEPSFSPGPASSIPLEPTKPLPGILDFPAFRPSGRCCRGSSPSAQRRGARPRCRTPIVLISRREPTFAFAFEESLLVFAYDKPPSAFALLCPRYATRRNGGVRPGHECTPFFTFFNILTPKILGADGLRPCQWRDTRNRYPDALALPLPGPLRRGPAATCTPPRSPPQRFCRGRPDVSRHPHPQPRNRCTHTRTTNRPPHSHN